MECKVSLNSKIDYIGVQGYLACDMLVSNHKYPVLTETTVQSRRNWITYINGKGENPYRAAVIFVQKHYLLGSVTRYWVSKGKKPYWREASKMA